MADLLRQIADFERARDELRDEIREAHSTLKALRHDVKEARKAEKDMERLVYETVAELIQANVSAAIAELDPYFVELRAKIDQGVERRIMKNLNMIIYGNEEGTGEARVVRRIVDMLSDLK